MAFFGKDATNTAKTKNRPKPFASLGSAQVPRLLIIISVAALILIGVLMIYSASSLTALMVKGDAAFYLKKHLISLAIALIACVAAALIPSRIWLSRISWGPWLVVVLLLIVTAAIGNVENGAQRSFSIPGLGDIQPSEFAKVAVIVVMAHLISKYQENEMDIKLFMIFAGVAVLVPMALIVAQPDLGTTIILVCTAILCLWFGELDYRPIAICLGAVLALGIVFIVASGERSARILAFLNPEEYADEDGYQTLNSEYALGSGGIFGSGLGNSYQKYGYLPEAHTDFIFSIIGEELGLVGCLCVIALFCVFGFAGIKVCHDTDHIGEKIIVGAATSTIVIQAVLNIACTVGWFPVTGKPLPFISYGGSSLISTMILVGLILAVASGRGAVSEARRRRNELLVLEGGRSSSRTSASGRTTRAASAAGRRAR